MVGGEEGANSSRQDIEALEGNAEARTTSTCGGVSGELDIMIKLLPLDLDRLDLDSGDPSTIKFGTVRFAAFGARFYCYKYLQEQCECYCRWAYVLLNVSISDWWVCLEYA